MLCRENVFDLVPIAFVKPNWKNKHHSGKQVPTFNKNRYQEDLPSENSITVLADRKLDYIALYCRHMIFNSVNNKNNKYNDEIYYLD